MALKYVSTDQDFRDVSKILNLVSLGFTSNNTDNPVTEGQLKYVDGGHVLKYVDNVGVKTIATTDDLSSMVTTFADLTDTTIATPGDGHVPVYDDADDKWKNKALSGDATMLKTGAVTVVSFTTANEATDTTCFPLFATGAVSANSAPKTNANFTFNSSTGDLGVTKVSTNTVEASSGTGNLWTTGVNGINIGTGVTVSATFNIFSGATASGEVKAINIGGGGVSGSDTNISIGSAVSGNNSAISLFGTVNIRNDASLRIFGSSTGYTTFDSANSSATNYTATLPAVTMTLAGGTGTNHYLSVWNSTNQMEGIAPSATENVPLISAGAGSHPTWSKLVLTNPATAATLTLANNSTFSTVGAYSIQLTATGNTTVTLPTSGTLATTTDISNAIQGLDAKQSVRVATTGALPNVSTWPASTITFSSDPGTIDGVTLSNGDRILVKDETGNESRHGIYERVSATSWTRADDADVWSELVSAYVFVEEGTSFADTGWVCQVDEGGTLNTTDVDWAQFSSAGILTPGRGLYQSGNDIHVGTSSAYTVGDILYASSVNELGYISTTASNKPLVSGASGTAPYYSKVTITNPATAATLTIADGATLEMSGAYTLDLTTTANATPTFLSGVTTVLSTGSSFVSGAIPYFSSTSTVGVSALLAQYRLVVGGGAGAAPSTISATGTSGQFLRSGGAAANPGWSTATLASTYAQYDILYASAANTVVGLTKGTLYQTLQAGASGVPTWGTIDLDQTGYYTGTLGLANGGTNANLTAGAGKVVYSTASAMALTAAGTDGQIFQSSGTAAPSWTTYTTPSTVAAHSIFVANSANIFSQLSASEGTVLNRAPGGNIVFKEDITLGRATAVNGSIKFNNDTSAFFVSFTPGNTTKDCAYTLPLDKPSGANGIMISDAAGVMGWSDIATLAQANNYVPNMYKTNISGTGGTVTAATHGCGTTPVAFVIELISTTKYMVEADVEYNASGDITWATNTSLGASSILFILG